MPVALRHNEELELNRAEYTGSITREELLALAAFFVKEPHWLGFDCLNLILPGADFDTVPLNELDGVYAQYMAMFAPLHFHISRRSAWICQSEGACGHMAYWLHGRDPKALSSVVREFKTYADACDWLVLNAAEMHAASTGDGFVDVARFDLPRLARAG